MLKTFGKTRVDLQLNEQERRRTELHNEQVKKNRDILKRLIDTVIFLGKQELAFRGHDESKESNNKGNYIELLEHTAILMELKRTGGLHERVMEVFLRKERRMDFVFK